MITDSQFYMWRTVFAIAHADGIVTAEEEGFMNDVLKDLDLSVEQRATLLGDVKVKQDIVEMYKLISDEDDRRKFFKFAKTMVWIDGDFGLEEQDIMVQLQKLNVLETNVDDLVGSVDMEFEDNEESPLSAQRQGKPSVKDIIFSFKEKFNEGL